MTGNLRGTARKPLSVALMGGLMVIFLILGVGGGRLPDAFRSAHPDTVVSAGAHSINALDYRKIFEQQKQKLEQQSQQSYSAEFLIRNDFDKQLLNQMAAGEGEKEMLTQVGIAPANALVDAQVKQIPAFFDRVTGKFSEKEFVQRLAENGITPRQLQTDFTDQLAARHFAVAVEGRLSENQVAYRTPSVFAALGAITALQSRDASFFLLDSRAIVPPAPPTEAQLIAFRDANKAKLTRPEMRAINLVRFSAAAAAAGVTVTDAEIQKEFDFRKDSLSTPETRTVTLIPARAAGEAAQAAHRLSAGEDPGSVAKAFGVAPVVYADKPRSAIPDTKLAAAVFAMREGQVAGPVQGDLGLAAVKVNKVTPARLATLVSVRAKIVEDLKAKAAQNKAYALSQTFDDARQGGASVIAAAAKAGVAVTSVGPFAADGSGLDGKPVEGINDKIAKAAFAMRAGEDSDVQDAGPGEYYAMHIDKVLPPAVPPMDQIRDVLTRAYIANEMNKALRAKADQLQTAIDHGQSMDAAAASVGAHVTRQAGMRIVDAQKYAPLGRELLSGIFGAKAGAVFLAGAPTGAYVAKVDAIHPGDPNLTARFVLALREKTAPEYLNELANTTMLAAEKATKATYNLALARKTMGVDPASVGPANGQKPAS